MTALSPTEKATGTLWGAVMALVLNGMSDEGVRALVEKALVDGHELRDETGGMA